MNTIIDHDFATQFELLNLELKRTENKQGFDKVFEEIKQLLSNKDKLHVYRNQVFEANKKRWTFEKEHRYKPPAMELGPLQNPEKAVEELKRWLNKGYILEGTTFELKNTHIQLKLGGSAPFKCPFAGLHKSKTSCIIHNSDAGGYQLSCLGYSCRGSLFSVKHAIKDNEKIKKVVETLKGKLKRGTSYELNVLATKEKMYELRHTAGSITITSDFCWTWPVTEKNYFKSPVMLRQALYDEQCIENSLELDAVMDDEDMEPEVDIENKIVSCGHYCPSFTFGTTLKKSGMNRGKLDKCPFHIEVDTSTIVLSLKMGGGKTQSIAEYINAANPEKILIVVFRRALADSIKKALNDNGVTGFVDYRDVEGDLTQDRLIVQLDSLHRIKPFGRKNDLFIGDEILSLLSHFMAETHVNARWNFYNLVQIVKRADKAIIADADFNRFSNRGIWFLHLCDRVYVQFKTKQNRNKKYLVNVHTKTKLLEMANAFLKDGKKIAVVSNLKSFIESCKFGEFEGKKYIGGKNNEIDMEYIKTKARYIAFSPAVDAGVDISISDVAQRFDYVFCYGKATDKAASVRSLNQMIGRIREIKSNTILYCIDYAFNEIRKHQMSAIFKEIRQFREVKTKLSKSLLEYPTNFSSNYVPLQSAFNTLWVYVESESRLSLKRFHSILKKVRIEDGCVFKNLKVDTEPTLLGSKRSGGAINSSAKKKTTEERKRAKQEKMFYAFSTGVTTGITTTHIYNPVVHIEIMKKFFTIAGFDEQLTSKETFTEKNMNLSSLDAFYVQHKQLSPPLVFNNLRTTTLSYESNKQDFLWSYFKTNINKYGKQLGLGALCSVNRPFKWSLKDKGVEEMRESTKNI